MQVLKIENNSGYFYSFGEKKYVEIDKIDKESLWKLVEYILNNDGATVDQFDDLKIPNKAQKIVYKEISTKLKELLNQKSNIISNIESKYKKALDKYNAE